MCLIPGFLKNYNFCCHSDYRPIIVMPNIGNSNCLSIFHFWVAGDCGEKLSCELTAQVTNLALLSCS